VIAVIETDLPPDDLLKICNTLLVNE